MWSVEQNLFVQLINCKNDHPPDLSTPLPWLGQVRRLDSRVECVIGVICFDSSIGAVFVSDGEHAEATEGFLPSHHTDC